MNLINVLGIVVCVIIFCINVVWSMMSNALLRSRATVMVLLGGCFWLNPVVIILFIVCRAVFVECFCLNPCCILLLGMCCVMMECMVFSSVFARGDRSAIGL